MDAAERAFTNAWWERLLADEAKLIRWLQKLYGTEFDGYQDNLDAAAEWTKAGSAEERIFLVTGSDEMRHAGLLETVLRGRGVWPIEKPPPVSAYWIEMAKVQTSLESCAAVFHLGEKLAADRFKVMFEHPNTPEDIMVFLRAALPDEEYHARIFRQLTDDATLEQITQAHLSAVSRLKGQS